MGSVPSVAFAAAALITSGVKDFPFNSASVATARLGPLPNPPRAMRADAHEPDDCVMSAPALTTTYPEAGWGNLTYAVPLPGRGIGMRISVKISLGAIAVVKKSVKKLSTPIVRLPLDDCTINEAFSAVRITGKSAAGSA